MKLLWSGRARRQLLQALGELGPASAGALTEEIGRLGKLLQRLPGRSPPCPRPRARSAASC